MTWNINPRIKTSTDNKITTGPECHGTTTFNITDGTSPNPF